MNKHVKRACAALAMVVCSATAGATEYIRQFELSGAAEATPNASPGFGGGVFILDTTAHTFTLGLGFGGLLGNVTAAHIHCCTAAAGTGAAGVATMTPNFLDFPTGVSSGSYGHLFDTANASSWNTAFITAHGGTPAGAEAALLQGLLDGTAYLNIHTSAFPGGEVRGFLLPVPEPETWTMLLAGVAGMLVLRRRRAVAAA